MHDAFDDLPKQPVNPYAAPASPVDSQYLSSTRKQQGEYASQNRRLVNFLVDSVATQVFSVLVGVVIGIVFAATSGGQATQSDAMMLQVVGTILGIAIVALYFILMEGIFGVTIGKLLTGTRVVNAKGGKPSLGQIVGRSFARMIPFEPFSFLFGDNTTGWHDSLSGTRVVRNR